MDSKNLYKRFDTYGFELFDEPSLKTSTENYNFQYVPIDQLQQVIQTVQRDRVQEKKRALWDEVNEKITASNFSTSMMTDYHNKHHRKSTVSFGRNVKKPEEPKRMFDKRGISKVIKNASSTIRIITPSKLESDSDDNFRTEDENESSSSPQEPSRDSSRDLAATKEMQTTPKVRIMTEDEIQNVIECAIKEAMHDNDDSAISNNPTLQELLKNNQKLIEKLKASNNKEKKNNSKSWPNSPHRESRASSKEKITKNSSEEEENKGETEESGDKLRIVGSSEIIDMGLITSNVDKDEIVGKSSSTDLPVWKEIENKADSSNAEENEAKLEDNLNTIGLEGVYSSDDAEEISKKISHTSSSENKDDEDNTNNNKRLVAGTEKDLEEASSSEIIENNNVDIVEKDASKNNAAYEDIPMPIVPNDKQSEKKPYSLNVTLPCMNLDDDSAEITTIVSAKKIRNPSEHHLRNDYSNESSSEGEDDFNGLRKKNVYPVINIRPPMSIESDDSIQEMNNHKILKKISPRRRVGRNRRNLHSTSLLEQPDENALRKTSSTNLSNITKKQLPNGNKPSMDNPKVQKPQENQLTPEMILRNKQKIDNERLAIFSKTTFYQNKIIEGLKDLLSTISQNPPQENSAEKRRREKYVVEFTARFNRNYLYQLEKMIEEIRNVPKEQFFSDTTNDNIMKICVAYGVIHQAILAYMKQSKYFTGDRSPNKLDVFLVFIMDLTKICIYKKIFDRNDTILENLQRTCSELLDFMREIEDNNKKNSSRRFSPTETIPCWTSILPKQDKLSMYDSKKSATGVFCNPVNSGSISGRNSKSTNRKKQLSKQNSSKPHGKRPKKVASNKGDPTTTSENPATDLPDKNDDPEMETLQKDERVVHQERLNTRDSEKKLSIHSIRNEETVTYVGRKSVTAANTDSKTNENDMQSMKKPEGGEKDMRKEIIEALKLITQEQVHKVLGPLVSDLSSKLCNYRQQQPMQTTEHSTFHTAFNNFDSQMLEKSSIKKRQTLSNLNEDASKGIKKQVSPEEGGKHTFSDEQQLLTEEQRKRNFQQASKNHNTVECGDGYDDQVDDGVEQQQVRDKDHTDDAMVSQHHQPHQYDSHQGGAARGTSKDTSPRKINSTEKYATGGGSHYYEGMSTTNYQHGMAGAGGGGIGADGPTTTLRPGKEIVEQQLLYDRNIQYTFITSHQELIENVPENSSEIHLDDELPVKDDKKEDNVGTDEVIEEIQSLEKNYDDKNEKDELPQENKNSSRSEHRDPLPSPKSKPTITNKIGDNKYEDSFEYFQKMLREKDFVQIFKDRFEFFQEIATNPLYVNENFPQPWKVVSGISSKLADDVISSVGNDISFGEKDYVNNFLELEMDM